MGILFALRLIDCFLSARLYLTANLLEYRYFFNLDIVKWGSINDICCFVMLKFQTVNSSVAFTFLRIFSLVFEQLDLFPNKTLLLMTLIPFSFSFNFYSKIEISSFNMYMLSICSLATIGFCVISPTYDVFISCSFPMCFCTGS